VVRASTERLWERLLQFIDERQVVPVVGQELLTVQVAGREVQLYSYLAERLAGRLGVPSDPSDSLNTVACRYKDAGQRIQDVYGALKQVLSDAGPIGPPESLLKLADIRDFTLFVSMTFDSLLETALNQRRFGGDGKTDRLAYAPKKVQDLPSAIENLEHPVVFHLLGLPAATPLYAVTDEDTLEFIHSLQSQDGRPKMLFDALREKYLLVIGCGFPDWLARFFIRIARQERFIAGDKESWVADERVHGDTGLQFFLEHFSATEMFPGNARTFVDELHARWMAAHPAPTAAPQAPRTDGPAAEPEMKTRSVFVSYASEDRPVVEAITQALEQAGIDVWFDRQRLELGDLWEAKIRKNIANCELFIAIISRHTLTPERRVFRMEWNRAFEEAEKAAANMRFIVPVAIDDTPESSEALPPRFGDAQWERLAGGQVTPEFVQSVVRMVRDRRKES